MADRFPIPDAALDDRLGFVGTSGSGKTYAAGTAIERVLAAKGRAIIVDPLGVWWGLRLRPDGREATPFRVVIFGGAHGDLPLTEAAGKLIGETVAGMSESAIVDLSGFATKTSERRFMLAFLEALYRAASGEPVHLVVDEADLFAPQKPVEPQLQALMEQIVRRGRIKGFIPWLITQRPAVISKDVLSQADGLVAMKLTSSQDRDAIGAWIEGQADRAEGKAMLARLPQLQKGEAVVWIPGRGVLAGAAFPPKATFDSSRTPKRGEKPVARTLRPIDLGALKDRLAAIEAEQKASDPKALKAEVARLTRALAARGQPSDGRPAPEAIAAAEARGRKAGYGEAVAAMLEELTPLRQAISDAAEHVAGGVDALRIVVREFDRKKKRAAGMGTHRVAEPVDAERARPGATAAAMDRAAAPAIIIPAANEAPKDNEGTNLSRAQRAVLRSLAWWRAMGHERPLRNQVAAVCGWSTQSSNIRDRLSELARLGLIDRPEPGRIGLTAAGAAAAPEPDMGATVLAGIQRVTSNAQWTIVDRLLEAPAPIHRDELAGLCGWSPDSSNIRDRLSELARLEIIERPAPGFVALQDWVRS